MTALEELQRLIRKHCQKELTSTEIPGLRLVRSDTVASSPTSVIYKPMVCLIAQGRKQLLLGNEIFEYDAATSLISSVDLPVTATISEAMRERPYLALSLELDYATISSLLLDIPPRDLSITVSQRALTVQPLSFELLDAFVRLLRLLHRPSAIRALSPLIMREIHYLLLSGEQSQVLRQMALCGSRTSQVWRVINWLRQNYAKPFRMEDLAQLANMSAPSLHRHFKAVTAMSPLQYQRRIRLHEARQILVSQSENAASVGFSVGYGSPSQFSREYSRLFGAPPRQDADRLLQSETSSA